jgi:hypothetical protein
MIAPLLLLLPTLVCAAPTSGGSDGDLASVYRDAPTWTEVFPAFRSRRALWERNWTEGRVPAELLRRAEATGGPWRILVIHDVGCSDSVNTVPYLVRLAESATNLELRIVESQVGRPWMEAHRSPDGRASTPTVLLLDEDFEIRGCWIEQPKGLQDFWLPVVAAGTTAQEVGRKMAWYEADAGQETLREFVEVMEAAARGEPICPGLSGARTP